MTFVALHPDANVSQGDPPSLDDERAPLLAKIDGETPQHSVYGGTVPATVLHDGRDRNKLIWAMVSVWLGTFCAGLGEHGCHVHIRARKALTLLRARVGTNEPQPQMEPSWPPWQSQSQWISAPSTSSAGSPPHI